jgi:hypothetical protein
VLPVLAERARTWAMNARGTPISSQIAGTPGNESAKTVER